MPSFSPADRRHIDRWAWLAVGSAFLLFSNGRWIVSAAAWVALPAWLVFVDRARGRTDMTIGFTVWVLIFFVAWRGLVPAPGILYFLITGIYAIVYFAPFLAHRLLAGRLPGLAATLAFPLAWVSVEFLFQRWVTPYGSWFSWAYTQSGILTLAQLASLTGPAGIGFVIAWVGALVAWSLRVKRSANEHWRTAAVATIVLAIPLAYGQVRLILAEPVGAGARMALLVPSEELLDALDEAMGPVLSGEGSVDEARIAEITETARRIDADLFARTRREARAGAELAAWSETAGRVLASDEAVFLDEGRRIAAEEGVTLLLAYGVWDPAVSPPLRNRVAAIGSDGILAWTYEKAHPIVGPESPLVAPGDGRVRVLDTPIGRLGAVICHDLDFPWLLRQAAREQLEIVIGPSFDWRRITDLHAEMATLRAIESGFTLVRPTFNGRSIVVDPYGRWLVSEAYPTDATVVNVPARRAATLYGAVGDAFAWASLLGFVGLAACAFVRQSSPSRAAPAHSLRTYRWSRDSWKTSITRS